MRTRATGAGAWPAPRGTPAVVDSWCTAESRPWAEERAAAGTETVASDARGVVGPGTGGEGTGGEGRVARARVARARVATAGPHRAAG